VLLLLWGVLLVAPAAWAGDDDETVVQEVLGILKERGIVDEEEYERLTVKNAAYEQEEQEGFLSRIDWSGDLRLRLENFWYDDTPLNDDFDRTRFRYRLRLQGLVPINDYVTAGFRLATGEDDIRSTNQTAGNNDPDFDPDDIFLDRAFVELQAPSAWLGESSKLKLVGGKQSNPFRWNNGRDYLLWDSDINPEGGGLKFVTSPTETTRFFVNTGYFILDENGSSKDPHLFGVQGGASIRPTEETEFGGRVTWYNFRSLNDGFFCRAQNSGSSTLDGGNLDGGLTDDGLCAGSSGNDGISAGELAAYFRYKGIANWPMLLYGHYARNFDAEDGGTNLAGLGSGDEEDTGWGVSLEIGDKKKYVKLGAGYYELEANFWPSQFIDSNHGRQPDALQERRDRERRAALRSVGEPGRPLPAADGPDRQVLSGTCREAGSSRGREGNSLPGPALSGSLKLEVQSLPSAWATSPATSPRVPCAWPRVLRWRCPRSWSPSMKAPSACCATPSMPSETGMPTRRGRSCRRTTGSIATRTAWCRMRSARSKNIPRSLPRRWISS
jgi:hypothetical protein